MSSIDVRRVFKTGNSLVISLPKKLIEKYNLHKGDSLVIIINKETKIVPMSDINISENKKESKP